jgi:hypothetical protein
MLTKIAFYGPKTDLYRLLEESPYSLRTNPKLESVKNSTIILTKYFQKFHDFDASNRIVLICQQEQLNNDEILMMPLVDTVVARSGFEGTNIAWQLRCHGFTTRVISLPPPMKPLETTKNKSLYFTALDQRNRLAFTGYELQNTNPDAYAHVHLGEGRWPDSIITSLASGIPVITNDRHPLSEFITHGLDGYLIRSPGDIVRALKDLKENHGWISFRARSRMSTLLDPARYLETLLNPEGYTLNRFPAKTDLNERTWIVRDRTLSGGSIKYFPKKYREDIEDISLDSLEEILEYFLTQHFSHVYVFGCELEEMDIRTLIRIKGMIRSLGRRARNIHFCYDNPVTKDLTQIFRKLSVISVEEGLKQVSG